jgi:hypothetical protein
MTPNHDGAPFKVCIASPLRPQVNLPTENTTHYGRKMKAMWNAAANAEDRPGGAVTLVVDQKGQRVYAARRSLRTRYMLAGGKL